MAATKEKVIIFAPRYDIHAAAAMYGLQKNGVDALWVPNIPSLKDMSISIDYQHDLKVILGQKVDMASIRSVWFRRPRGSVLPRECLQDDKKFIMHEWGALQKNLFDLSSNLYGSFWINNPAAAARAESKLLQLRVASEIGLPHPDTLVSNEPDRVKKFLAKHGSIVLKAFTPHSWANNASGSLYTNYVALLTAESELDDDAISLSPAIYQQYIEKSFDIRATLIGNNIYAYRIYGEKGEPILDWRTEDNVTTKICTLGYKIEAKLKRLADQLGIVFGCADFSVDKDGNIYFLEINQGGQFLFMEEHQNSLHLLKAFCAMLLEGRPNYSIETCEQLTFAEFKKSECYLKWNKEVAEDEPEENQYYFTEESV